MVLEIIEGPEIGRRVTLREGSTVSLGRAEVAMQKFPEDPAMSALHFVVSLNSGTLRMQNHSQTNGTLVNGTRVESAALQASDTIAAGGTVFRVIGPPPNPYPAQVRVGGWGFNIVPDGWKPLDGVGLHHDGSSEDADENKTGERIAQPHRHRYRIAAGFPEGRRKDLDQPEDERDFGDLALPQKLIHFKNSWLPRAPRPAESDS